MSITRDPDYPDEYAQLAAAFNRCAEGSATLTVLNASIQMAAASIGVLARAEGSSFEQVDAFTDYVSGFFIPASKIIGSGNRSQPMSW